MRAGGAAVAVVTAVTMVLAVGCGGRAAVRPVMTDACGPIIYHGSGKPDVLIVSDLPLRNPPDAARQPAGIERVLAARHYRAGPFNVGYQSCDDSSARIGAFDPARCTANANAYAADSSLVGVIGPFNSTCATSEIPVLDAAKGGALAEIGTATTDPTLTSAVPGVVGTPGSLYPAHVRNFVRLSAPDQFQAAAAATLARHLRLHRVAVLDDGDPYGATLGGWFTTDAGRVGVGLAGRFRWSQKAKRYSALAARVAAARPDGVYLAGWVFLHGDLVVRALHARLPGVTLIAPDGFADIGSLRRIGPAANGLLFTAAGVTAAAAGPLGRAIQPPGRSVSLYLYGATYGAAAADVLLTAIAVSDGSRSSVRQHLFRAHVPAGLIGSARFGFDAEGDPTIGAVSVFRYAGGTVSLDSTLYPDRALAKGTGS